MSVLTRIRSIIRWLMRQRRRDRNMLFTRDNIRIDHDIDYGGNEIVAYVEVWFDAEAKFSIKLGDDEHVNVYAILSPYTDELRMDYIIYGYTGKPDEEYTYKWLTQGEKNLIREMIEKVSLAETGKSVKDNWLENTGTEELIIYNAENSIDFVTDMKAALGIEITRQQGLLLINYMEGSGYALGISDSNLFRIDINEEDGEATRYTIQDAVSIILEWMDDFSKDFGETSMEDYTLADMADEHSYNSWREGVFGSWHEREQTRERLRQLKLDEQELRSLASKLGVSV